MFALDLRRRSQTKEISTKRLLTALENSALTLVLAILLHLRDLQKRLEEVVGKAIGVVLEVEGLLEHGEAANLPLVSSILQGCGACVGREVGAEGESEALGEVRLLEDAVDLHGVVGVVEVLNHVVNGGVVLQGLVDDTELCLPLVPVNHLLLGPLGLVGVLPLLGCHLGTTRVELVKSLVPNDRVPVKEGNLNVSGLALLELSHQVILAGLEHGDQLVLENVSVGLHTLGVLSCLVQLVEVEEMAILPAHLAQDGVSGETVHENVVTVGKIAVGVHFDESVRRGLLERKSTLYERGDGTSIFIV